MDETEAQPNSPGLGDNALTDYDTLYDIMTRRLSARRLKPDPLPDGTIEKILEAGRWAMSGANSQPWEYIVVTDPEKKQALFDAYQTTNLEFIFWMEQMRDFELRHPAFQVEGDPEEALKGMQDNTATGRGQGWAIAPALIVVLGDGRRQWGTVKGAHTFGRHASHFTDGLANTCTHMHLAIASLGLGAQWVTIHIQEPFKRILKVPDLLDLYLIISVGIPDVGRGKPGVRRPLSDIVHYDEYNPELYMRNSEIKQYLESLRGKVMFRYQFDEHKDKKDG